MKNVVFMRKVHFILDHPSYVYICIALWLVDIFG